MPPASARGTCSICGYRRRVRDDGMLEKHTIYDAFGKHECLGSWRPTLETLNALRKVNRA